MKSISEFLLRNNNLDSIVLLIIGIILGGLLSHIWSGFKILTVKFSSYIKTQIRKINRRIKGTYNLNELIQISEKPEEKRSKKEQAALNKFDEQTKESIEKLRGSLQNINSGALDILKRPYK